MAPGCSQISLCFPSSSRVEWGCTLGTRVSWRLPCSWIWDKGWVCRLWHGSHGALPAAALPALATRATITSQCGSCLSWHCPICSTGVPSEAAQLSRSWCDLPAIIRKILARKGFTPRPGISSKLQVHVLTPNFSPLHHYSVVPCHQKWAPGQSCVPA